MTILYRPVMIESAEQAEALPVGTVVIRRGDSGPWQKVANRLMGDHYRGDGAAIGAPGVVGFEALVPIEAQEETRHGLVGLIDPTAPHDEHRLVTPWEEA